MLDVERARIEIARAEVQRHPRLQLLGEIGSDRAGATGTVTEQEIVGPTQTMPPFDAQRMQAVLEARQADYLAAASELRSRAREAAREAEQGVSALLAAQARSKEAWLEQAMAWIHLYRVVGGGWSATPAANPQR
jgi:outer membrane protein TolC